MPEFSVRNGTLTWTVEWNAKVQAFVKNTGSGVTADMDGLPLWGFYDHSVASWTHQDGISGLGFKALLNVSRLSPVGTSSFGVIWYKLALFVGPAKVGEIDWSWDFASDAGAPPGPPPWTVRIDETLTGSLTITLPVEIVKVISDLADTGGLMPERWLMYLRKLRIGAGYSYNWTVTGSRSGAHTISDSGTVTISNTVGRFAQVNGRLNHTLRASAGTDVTETVYLTKSRLADSLLSPPGFEDVDLSVIVSATRYTLNGGFGSLTLSVTDLRGGATVGSDRKMEVAVVGAIQKWFEPFESGVEVLVPTAFDPTGKVVAAGGVLSLSGIWRERGWTAGIGGLPPNVAGHAAFDTGSLYPAVFGFAIDPVWGAQNSVPPEAQTLWIMDDEDGWFSGGTISLAAFHAIESFDSATGWTGSQASVISAAGKLIITATGGGAYAHKTDYALDMRAYRYLIIEAVSCSPARKVRLNLGDKYWEFDATATATDVTLDLCVPTGFGMGASYQPDDTNQSWEEPGITYGVQSVSEMRWTLLSSADGDVLQIGGLALTATNRKGTVIAPAAPVSVIWGGIDDWYLADAGARYVPVGECLADRKRGLMIPGAKRSGLDAENRVRAEERLTLAQMRSEVNAVPGISVSAAGTGNPASYYNDSLPAGYLSSEKVLPGNVFENVDNVEIESYALQVIPRYKWVTLPPGLPNLGSIGAAEAFPLRIRHHVWTRCSGLVTNNKSAIVGETVILSGGASASEGVQSDADGYFEGAVRAPALAGTIAIVPAEVNAPHITGLRRWAGFRQTNMPSGIGLSYDVSLHNRQVRAYRQDGTIRIGIAQDASGSVWLDRDTGIAGYDPDVRWERISAALRMRLLYESGGAILRRWSVDEGTTWSSEMTVFASGSRPRSLALPDGRIYDYCYASGAIKGVLTDAFDNVLISEYTAVATGVDSDEFDVCGFLLAEGAVYVRLLYRSGGAIVSKVSTDGVIFV